MKRTFSLAGVLLIGVIWGAAPRNVSAADVSRLNVAGRWTSNLGQVQLRQSGSQVTGTLRFSNGAVAQITGTVQGDSLEFGWSITREVRGDGTLRATDGGNRLSGPYTDRSKGTTGFFDLRRAASPATTPAPRAAKPLWVAGKWNSNLGPVEFRQTGERVTGTLRFSNGAVATINGTAAPDKLAFTWSIGTQVGGEGTLKLYEGGKRLAGPFTDRSKGTSGYFNLTRPAPGDSPPKPPGAPDLAAVDAYKYLSFKQAAGVTLPVTKARGIIRNAGTGTSPAGRRAVLSAEYAEGPAKQVFDVPLPIMPPGGEYHPFGSLSASGLVRLHLRITPGDSNPGNDAFTRSYPAPAPAGEPSPDTKARLFITIHWTAPMRFYAVVKNSGEGSSGTGHVAKMTALFGQGSATTRQVLVEQPLPNLDPHERYEVEPANLPTEAPDRVEVVIVPGNDKAILPGPSVMPRPRF